MALMHAVHGLVIAAWMATAAFAAVDIELELAARNMPATHQLRLTYRYPLSPYHAAEGHSREATAGASTRAAAPTSALRAAEQRPISATTLAYTATPVARECVSRGRGKFQVVSPSCRASQNVAVQPS